ncbi:MAG TPA: TniB family NTP-binding protein [Anaerolineales bacterium]|nr:TniB family NTP-binding protein [Anaerolineales bacterium]
MKGEDQRILSNKAREALETLDADARAKYVLQSQWIAYPAGSEILDELAFMLNRPPSIRSQGMAIIGSPNNGKTALLHEFVSRHQTERFVDRVNVRILDVQCPAGGAITDLYINILRRIGFITPAAGNTSAKKDRVFNFLSSLQVECLVVDEIHFLLNKGPRHQMDVLNLLKEISNEICIPIVIAGTTKLQNVIETNFEVASRYPIYQLPDWELSKTFAEFLVRLEATLPLKKVSGFWHFSDLIYTSSNRNFGNVIEIVRRAAHEAIISGKESISEEEIIKASSKITKLNE